MHVKALVAFFALAPNEQSVLLPEIPRDRGTTDFFTAFELNPAWLAASALVNLLGVDDQVPYDTWRYSVGLPDDWIHTPLPELQCVLEMFLRQLDWQNLFTRRALEHKTEWRLVRRLASIALKELDWPAAVDRTALVAAVEAQKRSNRYL